MSALERFIVTAEIEGREQRRIWDARHGLEIGFPVRFSLERDGDAVLIRRFNAELGGLGPAQRVSLVNHNLDEGVRLRVTDGVTGGKASLAVRAYDALTPVPNDHTPKPALIGVEQLLAFSCVDEWVISTHEVGRSFIGTYAGVAVLRIQKRLAGGYKLKSLGHELQISCGERKIEIASKGGSVNLTEKELQSLEITCGVASWRFAKVKTHAVEGRCAESEEDARWLRNTAKFCGISSALLFVFVMLAPKPRAPEPAPEPIVQKFERPKVIVAKKAPEPKPIAKVEKKADSAPKGPKLAQKQKAKPAPAPQKVAKAQPKPAPVAPKINREELARKQAIAETQRQQYLAKQMEVARVQAERANQERIRQAELARLAAETRRKDEARARLGKALGFVSQTSAKLTTAGSKTYVSSPSASTGAEATKALVQGSGRANRALSAIANSAGASGDVSIRSSRSVDGRGVTGGAVGGSGKVLVALRYNGGGGNGGMGSLEEGGTQMEGKGKLSQSALEAALSKYLQRFQYCYEKALLTSSGMAGNIVMAWDISSSGVASNPSVVRSQLNHAGLHNCLGQELSKIRFPAPQGGAVTVKYPFNFSSSSL